GTEILDPRLQIGEHGGGSRDRVERDTRGVEGGERPPDASENGGGVVRDGGAHGLAALVGQQQLTTRLVIRDEPRPAQARAGAAVAEGQRPQDGGDPAGVLVTVVELADPL